MGGCLGARELAGERPRTISDWVAEIKRWSAVKGFDFNWDQAPTFLMLIVTEASEAMQAWRDDDKAKFC